VTLPNSSKTTERNSVWRDRVLAEIKQRKIAVIGVVLGIGVAIPDVLNSEFSFFSGFGLFLAAFFFYIDTAEALKSSYTEVIGKLNLVDQSIELNTRVLRAHEHVLASRTTDNLTLVAFKNLLAYLPFYLAEDLGYFADEHIQISTLLTSLDDETTASNLRQYARTAIAICDPYMCVVHPDLQVIYPLCQGIAAWPMTLNWIGTSTALHRRVRVAAYKAPSTTHVLAHLVSNRVRWVFT
jgi:hypothetical protein